jgi:hypothetical protein
VHKWRQRHPDHPDYVKKTPDSTYGELTDDGEVSEAAADIYSVAAGHRETVKQKDAAAKARRKGARRG